jgi:CheY-like chemotaxis protein
MKEPVVLVLEDAVAVAETIYEILSPKGYRVVLKHTGADALDWARAHPPDLALVDLTLPDFSGREVIETLKREGIEFPFICISGAGEASVIVEMMKLGAKDYIQKGMEFYTLLAPVVDQVAAEVEREHRLEESERERRELQEKVRQAEKLESLSVLAGGIAHDFNNILSSIIGYTRLAMADLAPDSLAYANLQEVYLAGKRARDLVDQIANFSRGTETEKIPIDLAQSVRASLDQFAEQLPDSITLERAIDGDPVVLLANPVQIRRVLESLLDNARQAIPSSGGTLWVRLKTHDPHALGIPSSLPQLEEVSFAVLTVEDTGEGITAEARKRIFEPFFTTRGSQGGRGMGLSAAHGIVRGLGGVIEVDSEPGRGSVFQVFLPLPAGLGLEPVDWTERITGGSERILVVDDEDSITRLARQILERLGYSVTVANSGSEALGSFRDRQREFDLVLTDLKMPEMDGMELAEAIRSIRPDIPIVALTGSAHEMADLNLAQSGFAACLAKPISPEDLGRAVREVLEEAARDET